MVPYNPIETFLQEAEELLAQIEDSALALRGPEAGLETVNQLFRAFHTIKGSGGMCGFDRVVAFTHRVETALDRVREGSVAVTPKLVDLVLASADQIRRLLAAEQGDDAPPADAGEDLIALLAGLTGSASAGARAASAPAGASHGSGAEETIWRIRFRPDPGLFACGANPALLLRDLAKLGELEVEAHTGGVPPLAELRPEVCYLWWTLRLRGQVSRNAIQDAFLFYEDGSEIAIEAAEEAKRPESPQAPPAPASVAARSPDAPQKALAKETTVRVPASRLDRLVGLVGELVMNESRLAEAAARAGAPELAGPVEEIERLIGELRDNVLGIRMMPIGTIIGRFRRLVHDLSTELGKEVELTTEGEETELDKSVLDQLGEPLVHLFRNSIDHGIEAPEARVAAGKPRRGAIRLAAVHTGSGVVVTVEDDGRGIDREAVRAKAIAKALVAPDADLADKDILNMILLPGFSTARAVTNVSGRGVGMDVVKRQIEGLRGSLSIGGEAGRGTRVSLTLPLTLAIIEGLLIQVERDRFIVPLTAVTENVELHAADRRRNNGRNAIAVRGELISYIDLREAFGFEGGRPEIERIVIVQHEDQRVGLVVDRVVGTHQTVIQSLGRFFRRIELASGSTVMGDGTVALILDVGALVRVADARR
jgi:two-component system, chemotaxis family, sensor kinase CheA